jgi:dihydroorotate dehydrogenase
MVFFISPPFGNYLSLPNTIPIKGSYTLEPRPGLLMQVLKTLRYSFEFGGWVNRIGLRNPGLDYAIQNYERDKRREKKGEKEAPKIPKYITSIAILNKEEIPKILKKIPEEMDIELNVSCPNTDEPVISCGLKGFLNPKREWCILKLAPTTRLAQVDKYYEAGFRQFHCSNTYPIKGLGGVSGPFIRHHSTFLVSRIREKYPDTSLIAGGGVRDMETVEIYKRNGADYISVATLCMNPFLLAKFWYNMR